MTFSLALTTVPKSRHIFANTKLISIIPVLFTVSLFKQSILNQSFLPKTFKGFYSLIIWRKNVNDSIS